MVALSAWTWRANRLPAASQQQHQQIDGESAENGGRALIPRAACSRVVPPAAHAFVQRRDQPPDQVEQRKGDRHRQRK